MPKLTEVLSKGRGVFAKNFKSHLKKYWWIGASIVIVGIGIIVLTSRNNPEGAKDLKDLFVGERSDYSERIVKMFTSESGTAFKYASPMLYDEHIYIGTSERIGYDNAPISRGHDNYFYKFDLDLNVIWQYFLGKKMIAGGAVMDSAHNLYFVTELLDDKDNANKKDRIYASIFLASLTKDGEFRWEQPISDSVDFWDHSSLTPAISSDDLIYIGNNRFTRLILWVIKSVNTQMPKKRLLIIVVRL